MNQFHFTLPRLVLLAFAALLLGAGKAHARRGFKLWTVGETIDEIGQIKPELLKDADAESRSFNKVGFKYDYAGLFWLDLWNWGGVYCITDGHSYATPTLTPEQAAKLLGKDDPRSLSKPLNYRVPFGLVIVIGLIALRFVPRMIAKKKYQKQMAAQQSAIPAWSPPPVAPPEQAPPPPPVGYGVPPPAPPPVPPPLPPEQR